MACADSFPLHNIVNTDLKNQTNKKIQRSSNLEKPNRCRHQNKTGVTIQRFDIYLNPKGKKNAGLNKTKQKTPTKQK